MASELERRVKQNTTLKGRLQATKDQSAALRGGRNVNSAASRIAPKAKQAAPLTKKRSTTFTSPSMEWNRSGGPTVLGRMGSRPQKAAPELEQFLFSGAPSLDQFLSQASSQSGGAEFNARIADAERRKQEALKAIGFGSEDLARGIEGSRGTISAGYDTALQGTQGSLESTRAAMQAQQAATKQAQAEEFASLGLDARPDSNADSDAAFAQTILAAQNAATQDALRTNQASQNSLNTAYAGAARGRGLEDQNASRRSFDSNIAELLDARAAAEAQSRQQAQSNYQSAYSQWADQRDFAYGEWRRQDENDRDDARWLLEQQMSNQPEAPELSPYERYIQSQVGAGVTPGKAGQWANQASIGARNKAPMEQWIGGGSPQARSNLLEYLKSVGLI